MQIRSCLIVAWITVGAIAALTIGCSKPARVVPAGGVVTIDGKPAEGISLQFLPDQPEAKGQPTSYALTDSEGRFSLRTYDGRDGAVPGGHIVLLADTLQERPPQGQVAKQKPRLSGNYATVGGGVKATVQESGESVALKINSK